MPEIDEEAKYARIVSKILFLDSLCFLKVNFDAF